MKKHIISEDEYEEIKGLSKENEHKWVDKRLRVLLLRFEGESDKKIGEMVGYSRKRVSQLCAEYKKVGLDEYARRKYGGNHRNMSEEEEKEFLSQFEEVGKQGQVTNISEISEAYDKKTKKERSSKSTVYYLLHKHNWRQITPQTAHPGKATEAEIEASKKLTLS